MRLLLFILTIVGNGVAWNLLFLSVKSHTYFGKPIDWVYLVFGVLWLVSAPMAFFWYAHGLGKSKERKGNSTPSVEVKVSPYMDRLKEMANKR